MKNQLCVEQDLVIPNYRNVTPSKSCLKLSKSSGDNIFNIVLESNNQITPRKDNFGSMIVAKGQHKIKIDELKNTEHDIQKSEEDLLVASGNHNLVPQDDVRDIEGAKQVSHQNTTQDSFSQNRLSKHYLNYLQRKNLQNTESKVKRSKSCATCAVF